MKWKSARCAQCDLIITMKEEMDEELIQGLGRCPCCREEDWRPVEEPQPEPCDICGGTGYAPIAINGELTPCPGCCTIPEEPQPEPTNECVSDSICGDCRFRGNCQMPAPTNNACDQYREEPQAEPDRDEEAIRLLTEQVEKLQERIEALEDCTEEDRQRIEALEKRPAQIKWIEAPKNPIPWGEGNPQCGFVICPECQFLAPKCGIVGGQP